MEASGELLDWEDGFALVQDHMVSCVPKKVVEVLVINQHIVFDMTTVKG